MKRNPPSVMITTLSLATAAVSAAVLGFATAFELTVNAGILVVAAVLVCTLAGTVCANRTKGWLWLLIGSAVFAALMLMLGGLERGAMVIDRVTSVYQIYGWGATQFSTLAYEFEGADAAFVLTGGLSGAWVAYGMARSWAPPIAIFLAAWPVIPCFVVTHTVPHPACVFVLIVSLLTYLLAVSGTPVRQAPKGKRTALTAICVIVVAALLFVLVQPDRQYNQPGDRRDQLLEMLGLGNGDGDTDHTVYEETGAMLLNSVGLTFGQSDDLVMELYTTQEDILYMREQDYNLYQGGSWLSQPGREETMSASHYVPEFYISIKTPTVFAKQFIPYYIAGQTWLENGNKQNISRRQAYDWGVRDLGESWRDNVNENRAYYNEDSVLIYTQMEYEDYLDLPISTRAWAEEVLHPLLTEAVTNTEKADIVAEFVKNSARYSRDVDDWQWNSGDFARWFIETQDVGSCVHFATASAVLLRAANVPTRYVTGYLVEAKADEWTAVTEKEAHAWVEYYEPTIHKWIVLESTPLVTFSSAADETTTMAAAQTTTTVTTATTLPTFQTLPTSVTAPSDDSVQSLSTVLLSGTVVLFLIVAVMAQRWIRLYCRRHRQQQGSPNERAHYLWCEIERLSKALHTSPPAEAKRFADKAKFSRHTLTEEELKRLSVIADEQKACLRQKPWYARLWHGMIWPLY